MKTQAEQYAEQNNNDGQNWTMQDGSDWVEFIQRRSSYVVDIEADIWKCVFKDGSCIVVAGSGWDIGKTNSDYRCCCWPESGELCEHCKVDSQKKT